MRLRFVAAVFLLWGCSASDQQLASLSIDNDARSSMPGCARPHPGGSWPKYTLDDDHSRHQLLEDQIGKDNVAGLQAAWIFQSDSAQPPPDFNGYPIVTDGCLYIGSRAGDMYALNADTGDVVWHQQFHSTDQNGEPVGGTFFGSAAIAEGRVFIGLSPNYEEDARTPGQPTALETCDDPDDGVNNGYCAHVELLALDQATGAVLWRTVVDEQTGSDIYGTPVHYDGMLFMGISGSGAETDNNKFREQWQGSYVIVDAESGRLIKKHWTVHAPVSDGGPDDGFSGGSVYSTLAIDRERQHGYWGTGAPYDISQEAEITNSIIKVDLDRNSDTFGEIIGQYRGEPEGYFEALEQLPCIDLRLINGTGLKPPLLQGAGGCTNLNLDFGASVNLFPDPENPDKLLAGDGQKSGVYHIIDTETMSGRSRTILNPPSVLGGIIGNSGFDGRYIYGSSVIGGYLWSIDSVDGSIRWLSPLADLVHWGPSVALANGILYTVDLLGFFNAVDMETGLVLFKRQMLFDILSEFNAQALSLGATVVARNTVYATASNISAGATLIAYRLPE